ncbi:ABC transporter ATP-binding protein [Streptomyces yerevanensis]|uniref:ABC transporter ATP-binding protein n=1 Tax=Streptomyces yerevanensis TaxID=66378 RepID=UPI000524C571|nr:ABC transporter ATP-binding protein [Streptomyces yerevanensis]
MAEFGVAAPSVKVAGAKPATATGKALSVVALRKTYGDVVAVDEASMEIAAGEFVTFLGASGSGKTTTLMMIAGFCEPDSGTITVGGRDVTRLAPQKRNLGFVFQQYLLFPHMTVAENVAFPLTLRGDKKLRDQLQVEIKTIQQELGLTVIYVTHDQEEALVLSDRIAVMRNGLIEQFDTPRELFERPRTPFVADFLGAANFLPGRIDKHDGEHTLVRLDNSGGLLKARRHQLPPGTEVKVAVQPGRLRAGCTDDGFCTGTVEMATYVGTLVRAGVRVDGKEAPLLRLEVPAGRGPVTGERVGITADPEDVNLFADEKAG